MKCDIIIDINKLFRRKERMRKVSRLVVVALLILLVFTLSGCGEETLAEITNVKKGGGSLRCEVDEYTVLKVTFLWR